jgi:hypothetical protein
MGQEIPARECLRRSNQGRCRETQMIVGRVSEKFPRDRVLQQYKLARNKGEISNAIYLMEVAGWGIGGGCLR